MKARRLHRLVAIVAIGVVGFVAVSAFFAWRFTSPPRRPFGDRVERYLPSYENVRFPARDGIMLDGWFAPRAASKRAVVLLHGNGATRTQVLARARWFHDHDYAALLYDARGHGLSGGNLVSFGWYETNDLLGAIDWLRARNYRDIGCLGISQGGATIALAAAQLHEIRWAILESTFPTLQNAVDRRFRHTLAMPGWLGGLFMVPIAEWRLGVNVARIAPRETIANLTCPLLVITGEADQHTLPSDAREVFDRAPKPKKWIVVPGVAHVDLYGHARESYEKAVREFLANCE